MSLKTVRLGDVTSFIRGITFKPVDVVPRGVDGSVWCLRTKNVQAELDLSDVWAINTSFVKRSEQYLQAGDLLVSSANSWNLIGKCSWVPELESDAVFGGFVTVLRGNPQLVDRRYLYHWFSSSRTQVVVRSFSRQTTNIANLDLRRCSELAIPLPPLAQQKRIAAVLDQVDTLRAKRREAIALLDDLAQSIFLDMFGDPLRNPHNWGAEKIGSLLSIKPSYGTMIPATDETVGSLCIRVANIQDWSLDLSSRKYVNLPPSDIDRHGVAAGDLLMARAIATQEHLGKAIVADPGDEKWAFDSHIMRLRFNPQKADPRFVQALLGSPGGRSIFLKATRRSAVQYNINSKEISALEIPLPPIGKQKSFRSALGRVDKVREINRRHLAALGELFHSLQNRAFSGTLLDHEATGGAA